MNSSNRHGTVYPYFYCLGRAEKRTGCNQKVVLIDEVEAKVVEEYRLHEPTVDERRELEAFVRAELTDHHEEQAAERERQQHRIYRLESERQKLLQAHYVGAVPLDLLKSEQQRILAELGTAEHLLNAACVEHVAIETSIHTALKRIENCHEIYAAAGAQFRRQMNQASFTRIEVSDE